MSIIPDPRPPDRKAPDEPSTKPLRVPLFDLTDTKPKEPKKP